MVTATTQFKRIVMSIILTAVMLNLLSSSVAVAFEQERADFADALINYKLNPFDPGGWKLVGKENDDARFKFLHLYLTPNSEQPRMPSNPDLAPCQTIEIRVAASSDEKLVFKEGVGSLFHKVSEEKRKFVLTVAHLVADQNALVGVCNNSFYKLKLIAVDSSIDTAVLEVLDPDKNLGALFSYKQDWSPQVLEVEKLTEDTFRSFRNHSTLVIESLYPEMIKNDGYFYLQSAIQYSKDRLLPLQIFNRRTNLVGNVLLVAEKSNIFPGSRYVYKLPKFGVKPGMSGSPVFYYRSAGAFKNSSTPQFSSDVVMVGIVSKTRINHTESALVPFNMIYSRLESLLSGISNTSSYLSNNTLFVNSQSYKNLGSAPYKNSADEIQFPNNIRKLVEVQNTQDIKVKMNPGFKSFDTVKIEELLKNPTQIQKFKMNLQKNGGGADWGDGNGDLARNASAQFFYSSKNSLLSIYLDPSPHEASGIMDSFETAYYGILRAGQFTILKSVFSLTDFIREDLGVVLRSNGIKNKEEAFAALCALPEWNGDSSSTYRVEINAYGTETMDSLGSAYTNNSGALYAYCSRNKVRIYTTYPNVQAAFLLDHETLSGEIQVLGCRHKIDMLSNNLWERFISTEDFDAKLELGDGKDYLVKLNVFKIKKSCLDNQRDSSSWTKDILLGNVVIKWPK